MLYLLTNQELAQELAGLYAIAPNHSQARLTELNAEAARRGQAAAEEIVRIATGLVLEAPATEAPAIAHHARTYQGYDITQMGEALAAQQAQELPSGNPRAIALNQELVRRGPAASRQIVAIATGIARQRLHAANVNAQAKS